MMVVLFRSRLNPDVGEEYGHRVGEIFAQAREMPGFVSVKDFTAEDGERLALVEFESAATLSAWREHPDHRKAQAQGRDTFYEEYRLQVCELVRESDFQRDGESR